jgi:hypothetical protein
LVGEREEGGSLCVSLRMRWVVAYGERRGVKADWDAAG